MAFRVAGGSSRGGVYPNGLNALPTTGESLKPTLREELPAPLDPYDLRVIAKADGYFDPLLRTRRCGEAGRSIAGLVR